MRSPRDGRICGATPHSSRTLHVWRDRGVGDKEARNSSRRLRLGLCTPPGGVHRLFGS
jgi:hypothetical protein